MEIEPPDTLLGLYQGTPLTERQLGSRQHAARSHPLFQGPIEDDGDGDEDDIVDAIGETLIHELGHYFGLSEEEIDGRSRSATGAASPSPTTTDEDERDDDARAQALRPALPRAGLGGQGRRRRVDAAARRSRPRDRPGPRRAHAAAGRRAPARVLAVEIDRDLAAAPRAAQALPNVHGRHRRRPRQSTSRRAARLAGAAAGPATPVRVVGNLPYNISSPILFTLLDLAATHRRVSRRDADAAEGGRRPAGRPRSGTGDYGVLTVLTALRADVDAAAGAAAGRVPAAAQGALGGGPPAFRAADRRDRRPRRCSSGWSATMFTQRRKTLRNALKPFARGARRRRRRRRWRAAGIDPTRRPETLHAGRTGGACATPSPRPEVEAVL